VKFFGRLPILSALLVLLGAGDALAGFGQGEVGGLWRIPSARPLEHRSLAVRLLGGYHFQDVGLGSRFYFFRTRLDLGLGIGGFVELDASLGDLRRRRSVSNLDGALWLGTDGGDWAGGWGAADLSIKLSPPLPWDRLRLAIQANGRLPMASGAPGPEPGGRDIEFRGLLEWRLAEGQSFPRGWISLMGGLRRNRSEEGWGLAPSVIADDPWSPFPHYYPAEAEGSRDQVLWGLGLRFESGGMELFGEGVLVLYDEDLGMALRENLWQVALGLRSDLPRGFRLFYVVDMNLSRDDLETDFEPGYPRVMQSLGISRSWKL